MINDIYEYIKNSSFVPSLIVILIGIMLYVVLNKFMGNAINNYKNSKRYTKKKDTYMRLFKNLIKYIIIVLVAIIVLQMNGVNVVSLVAGIGIISIIVGLALQDAFKDIIMGFNLIVDEYCRTGDVVRIGQIEGKVIEIGLKTTKLIDTNTSGVVVIANRNISQVVNMPPQFDIDIPISYDEKMEKVELIMEDIAHSIKKIDNVKNAEYRGLNQFADSAIMYKVRIYCSPEYIPQLRRDVNRVIKLKLDENNLCIPFTQIDIHTKV